ncbi:helix-turn-helix transcriptional regulator [Nocardioides sp. SOB77]|uniref:Helix-turn-helix transcriptional regulator n=1 Tax=Nocardioides oceani TaxID=3058369 RepID=A0ABT8FJ45_9ACTN|nr:helix-turn-helix transcriptional regulator [Nocardioides oceani]MDN4174693.1 helix-turn-helix transcriptional regulator [Nocardioides oceani]
MTSEANAMSETLADAVARRVRGVMGEKRIRQAELALKLGVSQPSLSRRLNGDRAFELNEVEQVAAALAVSPAYLLGFAADREVGLPMGNH